MSVIDIHTHAFPDKIASRAMAALSAKGDWQAVGDGTIRGLLRSMDAADVDVAVVCAIATKPGQAAGIFPWQRRFTRKHGDRLIPLGSVHPADDDAPGWVARFAETGLPGLKLHPMHQDFCVDDEAVRPIYQAAVEHGLFVTLHCGRDVAFPNDPIPDRASPQRLAALIEAMPHLRLLCTHMGGWRMWDDVEKHLLGKNVYLETSFSMAFLDAARFRSMIEIHGPRNVCFGTDWPWNDQRQERAALEALGLSRSTLDEIEFAAAAELLGL